ncbi:hypothetical protein ACOBV8_21175 (plasmid) [Pseudoalteromonas espejiana]
MKIWIGIIAILTILLFLVVSSLFGDKVKVPSEQQAYLIPERRVENAKLQKLSAERLSNQQLYRRALSLWPVAYRELLNILHLLWSGTSNSCRTCRSRSYCSIAWYASELGYVVPLIYQHCPSIIEFMLLTTSLALAVLSPTISPEWLKW